MATTNSTVAIIKPKNDQYVQVTGLSIGGNPVTGATVTVTLVDERGAIVSGIESLPVTDISGQPGNYQGVVLSSFTTPPGDYVLQVTAVSVDGAHYYTEQAARVPYFTANAVVPADNLTTVARLKAWYNIPADHSDKDLLYLRLISNFTAYAKNECNRTAFLSQPYTQKFNGTGNFMLCPRFAFPTSPITAVTSLTVNGTTIPAALDDKHCGYVFDDSTVYLRGYCFDRGIQNVSLTYTAGLTSIPAELEQACLDACARWLKRRDFIGQDSITADGQTTQFDKDDVPNTARNVLDQYVRRR
ncbi:MAG TPA: hypothetical protein VN577_10070 [Terriglobales bacterium]|nr:hypothetical protein [Terriglobales bacterium]